MFLSTAVILGVVALTAATSDNNFNCTGGAPSTVDVNDTTPIGTVLASVDGLRHLKYGCVDQAYLNVSGNNIILARNLTGLCKEALLCSLICNENTDQPVIMNIKRFADYTLKFDPTNYTASVQEGSAVNTPVAVSVNAFIEQCDVGTAFSRRSFKLLQDGGGVFGWKTETSPNSLIVKGSIDYENEHGRVYQLEIQSVFVISEVNNVDLEVSGTTNITVYVNDTDDNNPVFSPSGEDPTYRLAIPEHNSTLVNMSLSTTPRVFAYDPDTGINSTIVYTIAKQSKDGLFVMDPANGTVHITQPLNRDNETLYHITIKATESNRSTATAVATLEVTVTDIDDHRPFFSPNTYTADVTENVNIGAVVTRVTATDKDIGENANFTYVLLTWSSAFNIQTDGTIVVNNSQSLDREGNDTMTILVGTVLNNGSVGDNNATVTVRLLDINDNRPVWVNTTYSFHVSNVSSGDVVGQMVAKDADEGPNANVTYTILDTTTKTFGCRAGIGGGKFPFNISPTNGSVYVSDPPVVCDTYMALVQACDNPVIQTDRRCAPTKLSLTYGNPQEIHQISQTMSVREDAENGSYIGHLQCTGDDYQGIESTPAFTVDTTTAFLKTVTSLDRETKDRYEVILTVKTNGQPICVINVTVNVEDVNDNSPVFENGTSVFELPENVQDGALIGTLKANDKDIGDNGQITYALQISWSANPFSINESSGEIRIESHADISRDMYAVVVVAMDKGKPHMETPVTVYVTRASASDGTVSVQTPWTVAAVRQVKDQLERDISALLQCLVMIETVDEVTPSSNQSARSRIHVSAKDTDGKPLSRDKLLSKTLLHYESIRALFYGSDPTIDELGTAFGASEIGLIAMAVVILIGTIVAICVIVRQFNGYKRYKRLYENLTQNGSVYESQELNINIDDETSDYNGSLNMQDLEQTEQTEQTEQSGTAGLVTESVNPVYAVPNHVTRNIGNSAVNDTASVKDEAIDSLDALSDRLELKENVAPVDDVDIDVNVGTGYANITSIADAVENDTGESEQTTMDIRHETDGGDSLDHLYENTRFGDDSSKDDTQTSGIDKSLRNDEPNPDYDVKQVRFSTEVLDTDENKLEPLKISEKEENIANALEPSNLSTKLTETIEYNNDTSDTALALEPRDDIETRPKTTDATGWAEDEINSPDNVVTFVEPNTHNFFFGDDETTAL